MSLLELPSTRNEAWRWSDLAALPTLATARRGTAPELPLLDCGEGPVLVFVDGVLDDSRSRLGPVAMGAVAAEDHPLARHVPGEGWTLQLGRDHAPAGLVQVVHLSTGAADHLPASIRLDTDAQASVVETYAGAGWTNRLTRIDLAKGARLMLARRLIGASGFVSLTDRAVVGEGGSLVVTSLAAGGADSRFDAAVTIVGEAGFAEVGGALLARGRQRHDANLALRHEARSGMSRQLWRAVADGEAVCSVAARVEVARPAQKTDGEQSLKGLLLARGATVNLKPELEIFAADVKCAQGATVGALDRNALFYLQSRGVPTDEARALLVQAFVADALARIGEQAVRDAFEADAMNWLSPSPLTGEGGTHADGVGG